MRSILFLIIGAAFFTSCRSYGPVASDMGASKETKKAYQRLKKLSFEGTMIGYEDALAYGIGWRNESKDHCDMYRISGEYPAVYGWDLGDIHNSVNLDTVPFSMMIKWIKDVHDHGGVNTISWHMDNPVNGNSSWDKSKIGQAILPEGKHHQNFLDKLDMAARFLKSCQSRQKYIPIIFRPYHEHNGDWFWWGKGNLTEDEYIAVFQFTVDYFKNNHNIHHLIYAFSPDRSRMMNPKDTLGYLYGYPGDNYVDIIGLDNYRDVGVSSNDSLNQIGIENLTLSLELITDLAEEKNKVAALTETGSESILDPKWFTKRLLTSLQSSEKNKRIAYILTWRNADTEHHFMSYPGHESSEDLKVFLREKEILTLRDIGKNFSSQKQRSR